MMWGQPPPTYNTADPWYDGAANYDYGASQEVEQRWAVLDAGKLLVYDPANQMRPRFTLVIQKDMAPLCDERALPLLRVHLGEHGVGDRRGQRALRHARLERHAGRVLCEQTRYDLGRASERGVHDEGDDGRGV